MELWKCIRQIIDNTLLIQINLVTKEKTPPLKQSTAKVVIIAIISFCLMMEKKKSQATGHENQDWGNRTIIKISEPDVEELL